VLLLERTIRPHRGCRLALHYNLRMRGWLPAACAYLREWQAVLRGLGDNPVREYLLLARRRRKTPFWLRAELARIPLLVAAGLLAIVFVSDLLLTDGVFSERMHQAAGATGLAYMVYISPWIGIPIVIWWLQVLYVWARDSLAVFSKDPKDPMALPEGAELALISRESILAGALSVLLPPVVLSVVWIALAGYTVIPWGDTANAIMTVTTGELTTRDPLILLPLALAGFIAICLFGSMVACLLTLALLITGCGIRDSASRSICAVLFALQQPVATLAINACYWWCASAYLIAMSAVHLIPSLFVVIVILAVFWSAALDWLASLGKSKPFLLGALMLVSLILHGLARGVLWRATVGQPLIIQLILPYAWILGFSALVNPLAVPDLRGLLSNSLDYYSPASHFPPTIWWAYPPVMLVVLLLLSWYALRRATRQVDRWRCTDR
jgi:hypothetical protein